MPQNSHSQQSTRKQKIFFLLAALVAASVTIGLGALSSISVGQDLEKLHDDKIQDPLQKYRDVSTLPMENRRVAFSKSSPQDKSDLFRIHLALYLAKHPELNGDQKQVILEGISVATPERYEMRSNDPQWKAQAEEPFRQFQTRALALFSRAEAARIFATLGEPDTPANSVNPQDDSLQKYIDISALPMPKRKVEFRKASPQGKSDLWRIHFSVYLAKHMGLSEGQKQVILDGLALLTPELFESPLSNPDEKVTLKKFKTRIHDLFSRDQAAEIFATLGGPEPPISRSNPEGAAAPTRAKIVGVNGATALNPPTSRFTSQDIGVEGSCTCSKGDDYCPYGKHCGGPWCAESSWGCGTLWMSPCNGTCERNSELNE